MASLCTICGRIYCDHTAEERGLTPEQWDQEMERDLTPEEQTAWKSGDDDAKIRAGRIAASNRYGKVYSLPGGDVAGL